MLPFLRYWLRGLSNIPTLFHLWCAERELRNSDCSSLTAEMRQARRRNLDLLRTYRLRGDFPHNRHDATHLAPCFVDSDDRQCAVAFLMDQTGARVPAKKIAAEANFARISDMDFAELEAWASESGLSKAELARIQPGYPPTPEQVDRCATIILSIGPILVLGFVSILFNVGRLVCSHRPRLSTISYGILSGVVLLFFAILGIGSTGFATTPSLRGRLGDLELIAFAIGFLAIAFAIVPLCAPHNGGKPDDSEPGGKDSGDDRLGRLDRLPPDRKNKQRKES